VDYKRLLGWKIGWVPALRWMPTYTTTKFGPDVIAGLSLAAFVIPESLASASLAQLPPVT
jgi:MFS superfamily sulfate permease-like transporter